MEMEMDVEKEKELEFERKRKMERKKKMERRLCSFVQNHDLDSFIQHYQPHVKRFYWYGHCQGLVPSAQSLGLSEEQIDQADWSAAEGAFLCDCDPCLADTANKCITFVLTLIRLCIFFRNTKAFEAIMSSEYSMGIYHRRKMDTDIGSETFECVCDIFFGVSYFREPAIQTLIKGPVETYIETILFVFKQDNFKYAIFFLDSMTWTCANKMNYNNRVEVIHRFFLQHDLLAVPDIRCRFLRFISTLFSCLLGNEGSFIEGSFMSERASEFYEKYVLTIQNITEAEHVLFETEVVNGGNFLFFFGDSEQIKNDLVHRLSIVKKYPEHPWKSWKGDSILHWISERGDRHVLEIYFQLVSSMGFNALP